jgi:transglutaminase-like putative cysteine protease
VLLEIEHRLSFDYDGFVRESHLELRMQPKTTASQTLRSFVLAVGPPTTIYRYRDWNDNAVHHFNVTSYHDRLAVAGRSLVETRATGPRVETVADPLPRSPGGGAAGAGAATGGERPEALWDFLQLGGPVVDAPALRDLHRSLPARPRDTLGGRVRALGTAVFERFAYRKAVTRYDSTTDDFLRLGAGVCQDFTHLMLGLLRLDGIPCRYVSGYLHVDPRGGEVAQSHAWVEVHAPSVGWVPFDPTHAREIDERYVVVAHGRHYEDVTPNRGIFRGNAEERLSAEVYTRVSEQKPVAMLREEIEAIDLPVFQEIPDRSRSWTPSAAAAATQQEQEQQ